MHKYLKKDDYITVLGFLMHITARNYRPKLLILVKKYNIKGYSVRVLYTSHRPKSPSEITVRNHHPKLAILVPK